MRFKNSNTISFEASQEPTADKPRSIVGRGLSGNMAELAGFAAVGSNRKGLACSDRIGCNLCCGLGNLSIHKRESPKTPLGAAGDAQVSQVSSMEW